MKNKQKNIILIAVIAALLITLVYFLALIPKTTSNLPKPSNISCSSNLDCSQNETCRRDISLITKNFFGDYRCLNKVWDGGKCETWDNCLSGTCSKGICLK